MSDLTQVQIEQRDNVVVARLTGELDISVAESTGRKIADAVSSSARGVVVDMSMAGRQALRAAPILRKQGDRHRVAFRSR